MRLGKSWSILLGLASLVCLPITPASAQALAMRTWVSGVGDDVNDCSRAAPCKTFAGAIAKTAAFGEIDALDPGGFSAVTITKSITIDGGGGQVASVAAGVDGLDVSAQATDVVILNNLRFQAVLDGLVAIRFSAGARLIINNCDIYGYNFGVAAQSSTSGAFVEINNTRISENRSTAITISGTANRAHIHNVQVEGNTNGLEVGNGNSAFVDHSAFTLSSNAGIAIDSGGSVHADAVALTYSANGVIASGSIGIGNSDISFNTVAFQGTVASFGNNRAVGNSFIGTTPVLPPATTDHGQL